MSKSRYSNFVEGGQNIALVPFIKIPKKSTDYYVYYEMGKTRLDILSYEFYKNPNYDWLIMQANPQYGSLEFKIPNKALLRIPYPLEETLARYESDIQEYKELYGLK